MLLPLAYYGDDVLRKKAAPLAGIDDSIRQLVADMAETMEANNGCGLAAPQVHHSIALFITRMVKFIDERNYELGELKVYINPKIISYSDELIEDTHGCLSVPKIPNRGILRPNKVTVEATDINGNRFTEELEGTESIAICHENDHLNGVLFFDRLHPRLKKELEHPLRELKNQIKKQRAKESS